MGKIIEMNYKGEDGSYVVLWPQTTYDQIDGLQEYLNNNYYNKEQVESFINSQGYGIVEIRPINTLTKGRGYFYVNSGFRYFQGYYQITTYTSTDKSYYANHYYYIFGVNSNSNIFQLYYSDPSSSNGNAGGNIQQYTYDSARISFSIPQHRYGESSASGYCIVGY